MSPWATFYAGRDSASYLEYAKQRYAPFIDAIAARIEYHDNVIELGAGTGTITAALQWHSLPTAHYTATDIDPDQLQTMLRRFKGTNVCVGWCDVKTKFVYDADVVHSHGMLEHFDDDTIRHVIATHRTARTQVHYVPGLYPSPTFGDERLMSVDAWWKICKPSQIITFNDGLDYALVFE